MNIRNLVFAAAIAIATASSPALAASHHNSQAGFNAYGAATDSMSTDRTNALRECNDGMSKRAPRNRTAPLALNARSTE